MAFIMETVEEKTLQVRVPEAAYQLLREEAFRLHEPMTRVLERIIIKILAKSNKQSS